MISGHFRDREDHLTDQEIQQYVLQPSGCEADLSAHLEGCEMCRQETEIYRNLFSVIGQEPKPIFDFDLAAMVLTKLTESARDNVTHPAAPSRIPSSHLPSFIYGLVLAVAGIAGILVYLFKIYLMPVFSGISQISLYLTILTTVIIFLFQGADMYKKYQRQLRTLNQ
jgi:hypothetical protein